MNSCPVHLPGQNIFCPGQNVFCPGQLANLDIFVGDYLRVLNVRNCDGIIRLEDSQLKMPHGGLLADSSSEEEE